MPFDGSGNYTPLTAPAFPAVTGQTIVAAYYNSVINDLAVAISNCITRDGQGKPSAAINWNGQNLTNVNTFSCTGNATVGGNVTVTGSVTIGGNDLLTTNGTRISFEDANGGSPYFTCQVDNNFVFNSTDATGAARPIWSVVTHNSTAAFIFNIAVNGVTATPGDNTTQFATTAFVQAAISGFGSTYALLASPAFTGNPTAPTQTFADNSTKLATTAFVQGAKAAAVQVITSNATITPVSTNDMVTVSALAAATNIANVSGTPTEGWGLVIRIKDNATPRAITYGTGYRGIGLTLPATTVASKWLYLGMVWNATDSVFDVLSAIQQ